jgi:hypothetical protein
MDYSWGILIKMVLDWLRKNRHRFNHQPYIVQGGLDYLIFRFSGIAQEVILVVREHGAFEIHIRDRNFLWDIAEDFDVAPAQSQTGLYYCQLCFSSERKYYSSLSELVHEEALEPLLDWTNQTFQKTKWIGLFQNESSTYIKIVEGIELFSVKSQSDFVDGFPIVQTCHQEERGLGNLMKNKQNNFAVQDNSSLIGIFWIDKKIRQIDLVHADPLQSIQQETGDEFINGPHAHFVVWELLKAKGSLPEKWRDLEYEVVPRGRVLYDCKKKKFKVYTVRNWPDSNGFRPRF